ncbi:MAG TPA: hypothetical protein PK014_00615 [Thermoanaerobaculia bacterium]|nr:hypothetical protein [Thermoanaerobaculia bacterium]HXK66974.1 hypothetical protein [Thermoanaerobaculia bacterium]
MAEHLASVWSLIREDDRIQSSIFPIVSESDDREEIHRAILHHLPFPKVCPAVAYTANWDLLITADRVDRYLLRPSRYPALRVQHGVAFDRISKKDNYLLRDAGSRGIKGLLPYARVFVSSERNLNTMVTSMPELKGAVRVVGNLHDDRMLELNERRSQVRRDLGWRENERIVYVMGHWGKDNLYRWMGLELITRCQSLSEQYSWIFDVHPNEYRKGGFGLILQSLSGKNNVIRSPHESWIPFMVACDACISDHTSHALHAMLLGKPVILASQSLRRVETGSILHQLGSLFPNLNNDASNLKECLTIAMNNPRTAELKTLSELINSAPGQYRSRARKEIYDLLNLAPLENAVS